MEVRIKQMVEQSVLQDVICNKCGKSCKVDEYNRGGFSAIVEGAYGSEHINDGDLYVFDICEECAVEFMRTFTISAENLREETEGWNFTNEQ